MKILQDYKVKSTLSNMQRFYERSSKPVPYQKYILVPVWVIDVLSAIACVTIFLIASSI